MSNPASINFSALWEVIFNIQTTHKMLENGFLSSIDYSILAKKLEQVMLQMTEEESQTIIISTMKFIHRSNGNQFSADYIRDVIAKMNPSTEFVYFQQKFQQDQLAWLHIIYEHMNITNMRLAQMKTQIDTFEQMLGAEMDTCTSPTTVQPEPIVQMPREVSPIANSPQFVFGTIADAVEKPQVRAPTPVATFEPAIVTVAQINGAQKTMAANLTELLSLPLMKKIISQHTLNTNKFNPTTILALLNLAKEPKSTEATLIAFMTQSRLIEN